MRDYHMSVFLQEKLKILSFIGICLIVLLHSYNLNFASETQGGGFQTLTFIEKFIGDGICRVAVPVFFFISGFLFYITFQDPVSEIYKIKLKSRFTSLLVPFIIFSLSWFLIFVLLVLLMPGTRFINRPLDLSGYGILDFIVFNPIPYQLWFIRDLFLFVLISPILFYLFQHLKFVGFAILILLAIYPIPYWTLSKEGLIFFSLGGALAIHYPFLLERKISNLHLVQLYLLWISLLFIRTNFAFSGYLDYYLVLAAKLTGLLAFWYIPEITIRYKDPLINFATMSFFIFLAHEPLLTIVKKLTIEITGTSPLALGLSYFLLPLLVIWFLIKLGNALKTKFKRIYMVCTGGR